MKGTNNNQGRYRRGFALTPKHFGVILPQSRTGFTLVEMLVAISLFTIVMTIIGGSLVTVINANREVRAMQIVVNNLNFALDDMVRSMRVGTTYDCGRTSGSPAVGATPCPNGDDKIAFVDAYGNRVYYRKNGSQIEKKMNNGSFVGLTSPQVAITDLQFYVTGTTILDSFQPRVLIVIRGEIQVNNNSTTFDIQTTVVQRVLDR